MQVELLYHTPDPERAIATAARLCYAPVGASELMETMPPERVRSVLSTIMGSGHFSTLELRCCNRAQWEIREMAWKMLELARPTAPYIFADAGAPCIHGTCPEGKMTCGNPYPRVDRSQLDA